jgi:hypothetical protein
VLAGDVFSLFNPWLAIARALRFLTPGVGPPRPYPKALGRWPAAATIVAFGWLELVYLHRDRPATLAVLAFAYALAQLVGMAWFGIETWTARADGFAVAFNLFSRLSAIDLRDRAIWLRRPLSGTTALEPLPGTVALVCAMLGTTTFDGFLNGPVWRSLGPPLARDIARLGLGAGTALELTATVGMAAVILLCLGCSSSGSAGWTERLSADSSSTRWHRSRSVTCSRTTSRCLSPRDRPRATC